MEFEVVPMVLLLQVWEVFLLPGYEFVAVDAEEGVVPVPVPAEVLAEPKVDSGGVVKPEAEPVAVVVPEHVVVSLFYFFVRSSALICIVVSGPDGNSFWK